MLGNIISGYVWLYQVRPRKIMLVHFMSW